MTALYRVRTAIAGGSGAAQVGTHYFDASGAGTAQDAATAVRTFWDSLKASISSSYTFQVENVVETIDSTTGNPTGLTAVTNTLVTGTGSGSYCPSATQAVIQWRTGLFVAGREIRGRTFVPGIISSALSTTGTPGAALVTAAGTAITAMISPASSDFGIYSRKNGSFASVTSGAIWGKFGVLRSRRD